MHILAQVFFSDLCWRQIITSFPRQLQSERFLYHPILNQPNLLRGKLILFLALHSLCAPKLSQTPLCFPSSVEWGWGITLELTVDGWPASKAWFNKKKKPTRLMQSSTHALPQSCRLLKIGKINYLHQVSKCNLTNCPLTTKCLSFCVVTFSLSQPKYIFLSIMTISHHALNIFTSCLLNSIVLSTVVVLYDLWI